MSSTMTVEMAVSLRVGHVTFEASWRTSRKNCITLVFAIVLYTSWQGQQDSNPRPAVLETAALPAELYPFCSDGLAPRPCYSMILATTPAPTVRPPSRMAKRRPSSMAIGWISCTSIEMLSPGITISVPSGSRTVPVTSVVRK